MQKTKSMKRENSKKEKTKLKKHSGITLIALVITIVLNCCRAAMERILKKVKILKI